MNASAPSGVFSFAASGSGGSADVSVGVGAGVVDVAEGVAVADGELVALLGAAVPSPPSLHPATTSTASAASAAATPPGRAEESPAISNPA